LAYFLNRTLGCCGCSDNLDSNSMLENSLSAKEKIISELNLELHNIETTLSNERDEHMKEIKRLNALLNEKVCNYVFQLIVQC
jgi:vacuolar-type H+-ATPase subunit I/STV1